MDKRYQDGFSFIELIIVITLLGILAMSVMSMWPSNAINLNAQTRAFVADIRYTQNLAVTRGVRYYLTLSSATTYNIRDFNGGDLKTYTLGSGISFGNVTNLPNSLIAFDGHGTPYTNATLPGNLLTANATIALNASNGSSHIVTITQTTGQVSS